MKKRPLAVILISYVAYIIPFGTHSLVGDKKRCINMDQYYCVRAHWGVTLDTTATVAAAVAAAATAATTSFIRSSDSCDRFCK